MKNIPLKIIGIILILAPIIAVAMYVVHIVEQPVPVLGSPFIAIILWVIGAVLITYKPKK